LFIPSKGSLQRLNLDSVSNTFSDPLDAIAASVRKSTYAYDAYGFGIPIGVYDPNDLMVDT
jgi:hypothetical protein